MPRAKSARPSTSTTKATNKPACSSWFRCSDGKRPNVTARQANQPTDQPTVCTQNSQPSHQSARNTPSNRVLGSEIMSRKSNIGRIGGA